jgi:hypothetical protein
MEVEADGQDSEDDITTLTALTVGVSVPCSGSFDKYLLFAWYAGMLVGSGPGPGPLTGFAMSNDGVGCCMLPPLQLDVELSQAPSAGSVQLELWCGRDVLASAPLLILPAVTSGASGSDSVLEELQGYINKSSGDTSALLSDLGQVLYSVDCINQQQLGNDPVKAVASSNNGTSTTSSSSGPASWGGVVSSLAQHHASDPEMLASMLVAGDDLLQYAKSEGLKHTASQLLVPGVMTLHQRLERVKGVTAEGAVDVGATTAEGASDAAGSSKIGAKPVVADTGSGMGASCSSMTPAEQSAPSAYASAASAAGMFKRASPHPNQQADAPAGRSDNWLPHKRRSSAIVYQGRLQSPTRQAPHHSSRSDFKQCLQHAVLGFKPAGVEQAYKQWMSERCRSLVCTHSILLSLWVIASLARSSVDGWQTFVACLPAHLWCAVPWFTSAAMSLNKQDR